MFSSLFCRPRWGGVLALLAASVLGRSTAVADNKYLEIPDERDAMATAAYRYANLDNDDVERELKRRHIPFVEATPPMPGVRYPVRLGGPLNGVLIRSVLPDEERSRSPFEILDGRLALALDDFTRVLAQHDIVEIVHFTMYRPAQSLSKEMNGPQTRHPGGLAIDLGAMKKRNGQWLAVGPHWSPQLGAKTCGEGARELKSRRGRELVSVVCEASDHRLFHYMLTPHFDHAHADHLHLEIKPGVKWFLVN